MLFQLGPYQIIRELPQLYGGYIYEALDQTHCRRVTLTQCPATWATEEILQRLELEARTSALLNHPNIARVFGFIRRDERVYLVTEFVRGATLEKILNERRSMPAAMAITLFRQIMSGVATAHRSGVVHGDLRPANVVVPDFGPVKILNLAFAHAFRQGSQVEGKALSRYLAPEQLRGESPDARSDIYSLGVMLYESIVGEGVFDCYASSAVGPAAQQFIPARPSMALPDLPKRIDELLLQMTAPDPARRFQSIRAVTRFLDSAPGALENSELSISSRGRVPAGATSNLWWRSERYLASVISPKFVSTAGFFVLIAAAMFFFRGENISELNISELMDTGSRSKPSLNQSVDAMFSRIGTDPTVVDRQPTDEISATATRKTARRDLRASEDVSGRVDSASIPVKRASIRPVHETVVTQQSLSFAPPQRRAAEAANPNRETNVAATEVIHREEAEAREPVRSTANNALIPRLKVEWEN